MVEYARSADDARASNATLLIKVESSFASNRLREELLGVKVLTFSWISKLLLVRTCLSTEGGHSVNSSS